MEIYIILLSKFRFVMLDEPFSHLMPRQIEKIKELMLEEKKNKGLFITDHLYREVTDLAGDLYILTDGKTYLTKDPEEIITLGYGVPGR